MVGEKAAARARALQEAGQHVCDKLRSVITRSVQYADGVLAGQARPVVQRRGQHVHVHPSHADDQARVHCVGPHVREAHDVAAASRELPRTFVRQRGRRERCDRVWATRRDREGTGVRAHARRRPRGHGENRYPALR